MTVKGIEHVAVAVRSIGPALEIWCDLLGWKNEGIEDVPGQGAKVARLSLGAHTVELVEPLGPSTPLAKSIEARGPGLHHLCFDVTGIRELLGSLAAAGVSLVHAEPQPGAHGRRIAFIHPRSMGGVLVELSEAADGLEETRAASVGEALEPAAVERLVRALEQAWKSADFTRLGHHYHPEVEYAHPFVAHGATIIGREKLIESLKPIREVAPLADVHRTIECISVAGDRATVEYGRSGPAAGTVTSLRLLHGKIRQSRTYCDRPAIVRGDLSVPV